MNRRVKMTKSLRIVRNVPVLVVALVLLIAAPGVLPSFAQEAPPAVTAEQLETVKKLIQSGAPLPPEAQKLLEAHPELKGQLPPEVQKKLEAKEGEKEVAKKPAPPPLEPPASLPSYDWRKSTYVGNLFSKRLLDNEAVTLAHFGHDLFAPRPGAAAILETMPVSPDYVIGPGDEVVVKLWGRMEGTHRMVVDRDGKIFFPKLGSLYVAGKTFSELKAFLRSKTSTMAEVSSDVSLGQMKGIRVSVIGEVRSPGWYNVSSLHTALQALFLAGGIKDIGSLRRIELRRGGKAVDTIDLYDFLLKGNTRSDTNLLTGDTIFVPVVGKLVAIAGEVRRPAIYELSGEKTLLQLVGMAGGFAPSAYKRRLQVERLEGHYARTVLDIDAEELESGRKSFDLSDGDIVRVLPIVVADENSVALEGNVLRPGKYELTPGMTVAGLLPDASVFLPETYFDYALLTRLVPPDLHKEVIPVNLREIVLERKPGADVALKPRDTIKVFPRSAFRDLPKATISGEVRKPGAYDVFPGTQVSDLIKLSGDLTRDAYLEEAELSRLTEDRQNTIITKINLRLALAGDASQNLVIRDRDHLMVRPMPDIQETRYITLKGEVRSPGVYAARKGERLSSVIQRAGGFTQDAYLRGAQFTRVSTQKSQQAAIDKLIEDLELEVAQKAQQVSGAIDKEDVEASRELLAARRALIAQLKKTKAKGRVIIRLADGNIAGTPFDLNLEDGDALDVPKKMSVVNVVGRVYNPTAVVFNPAKDTVGYNLDMVGGPTASADTDHIFVLRVDGSVFSRDNTGGMFSGGLLSAKVEPGDTIMVPEKLIQVRAMKDVKDITQILMQIAVTVGVLIALF